MSDNRSRLEWAQFLASKGINIFIVKPGSKNPLDGWSWYARSTSDPAVVADLFSHTEDCNYGAWLGKEYVAIDLDIDLAKGKDGIKAFEKICAENGIDNFLIELNTLMVRTPSQGYHLIFKAPHPCGLANDFPAGIDVRGVNGYVVGPGSSLPNGDYALVDPNAPIMDLPEWLHGYVRPPGKKDPKADIPVVGELDQPEDVEHALKWLETREPAIANGTGEPWTLETCLFLRDFGLSQEKILWALNQGWNQRCEPPWDADELAGKIDNAWSYGQNRPGCKAPSYKTYMIDLVAGSGVWAKYLTPQSKAELFHPARGAHLVASTDPAMADVPDLSRLAIYLLADSLIENLEDLNEAVVREDLPLFERGGAVVSLSRLTETEVKDGIRRPVGSYVISALNHETLQYFAMKAATFLKYNERKKGFVPTECPVRLVNGYLKNHHVRGLRPLHGIAQSPTLRPDGSVLQTPGYDPDSALFVMLKGKFPKVPENPTREDAEKALEKLRHVVRGIMFTGKTNIQDTTLTDAEAVWLALTITSVIRNAIPTAPLFGISAPTKGSGKTLAADLAGIIATGNDVPAMSIPDSEEEIRKTLFSSLLSGDEMVLLDNVKAGHPLKSDALNAILTKTSYEGRVLGASQILTVPVVTTFVATGNNFSVGDDLRRRTLICYINPLCEEPDKRYFDWDARKETQKMRGDLVSAVLTVVRAYLAAGAPDMKIEPYGSFEDWTRFVRSPLVWLGVPDPVRTRRLAMAGDDEARQERALVSAWVGLFGENYVTVKQAITDATRYYKDDTPDEAEVKERAASLKEVLEEIAINPRGEISNQSLGIWLRARINRTLAGYRIEGADARDRVQKWRMVAVAVAV